ncbi:MAG TPA: NAD(P)H-dependent oxidoreductase [Chloroflexi bacterium]|jgi:NAD(P)H dehydrogenase (quinone)|nr:NAD(P)H-dependent oxidoreductase [Chloroflexota bacterium]
MKILVVLGHPDPGSFNHAIAYTAVQTLQANGHEVIFHDLYAERFDPLIRAGEILRGGGIDAMVARHCAELTAADGIVVVHPNWWGQPPAILKGWVDRVFRPGVAYTFADGDEGKGVPIGLLRARTAVVLNTSNTPRERELEMFGDLLETLWKSCIFDLCGVRCFARRMFGEIVTSTPADRHRWLREVHEMLDCHFPRESEVKR